MSIKIDVGDIVTVKGRDYGYYKVHKILPKGSHGRKCVLVEVLHSQNMDFSFALIHTFRMIDLKKELK